MIQFPKFRAYRLLNGRGIMTDQSIANPKEVRMKKALMLFSILVFALLLVPTAFAEGGKEGAGASSGPVTLRLAWWGNPTRDERTLKVVDLYMKMYPNVTIEPETVGWGGYWDRINTQVASGSMPDVMQHDYAYLLQFVGRDLMADLTPAVKAKAINLDGVDESFISGGRVNGKLYGVNLGTNATCLTYDPAILAKAGVAEPKTTWTWADFEKMATTVFQKTGVQTLPFFTTDPRVGFENWIRQTGKPFFQADGKALGFTDSSTLEEYWNIQLRLLKAGVLMNPETAFVNVSQAENPLTLGKSWVEYLWSNQVVAAQAAANRPLKVALPPKITKGYTRPGNFLKPSMFFSIPKSSKIQAEGARFINFFISNADATKVLLIERGVPIVPAVRDGLKDLLSPGDSMIVSYIGLVGNKNASPIAPPDPPVAGEILKLFKDTTMEVLTGKTPAKDGAAKFMTQANAILAK
jgi:multiple sugar transport system substrate-binding protein